MAHRGRLNVLVNVLGKAPSELFSEFEGKYDTAHLKGSGDVKYHKGFSADLRTPGGNVHVALAFNPSHLEVVNPVVEGSVRARQERRGDRGGARVLPVLIHGDAAFAGQGVVMETLQLSQARAFYTGGTVHLIINNQVGFTTSDPRDTRSTMYCSDVAKMLEAPIFHVNADDPEAVVFVTRQALAYRMKFHKDVVIDLVCYRRLGHNEADEPAATQPVMYAKIRQHPTARQIYADRLAGEGVLTAADADALHGAVSRRPRCRHSRRCRASLGLIGNQYTVDWSRFLRNDWSESGRDRHRAGAAAEPRRAHCRCARGLQAASARGAGLCQPPQDAGRRAAAGLGLRRDAGLCRVARRRLPDPPHRPGQRPRHVLPSPRGAAPPGNR